MRAVNLLPKEEVVQRRKQTSWPVVVGLAGGAVVVAALGAAVLQAGGNVSNRQNELADASALLASMPAAPKAQADNSAELAQARTDRALALASAFSYHLPWDRVLRRFALVLPDDVWLTGMSASAPARPGAVVPTAAPNAGALPTGVTIQGYTYSLDGVARLLARLAVLPDLANVQLQTSSRTKIGERPVVSFTIVGDVRPGVGS